MSAPPAMERGKIEVSLLAKVTGFFRSCFPRNIGGSERRIRLIVGVSLMGLSFTDSVTETQEFWLVVVGWLGILSGIVGHCPIYGLLGRNTAKDDHP